MKKFISVFAAGCVSLSATAQVFLPANALSPYYESFSYQSADELSEALEAGFSDDVIAEIESKETDSNKGAFRSFLNAVDECGMYIPVFDGEQLPYWSVSIQTHDMYKNTNIYYSYAVNESDVSYISIMYLDPEIKDSANINGVEWLKNQINPNGIDSEIQYPKYDSSNSLNIQLADRNVPVLLGNFEDDSRDFLEFVYDDVFVRFVCKTNILDSENLIKEFSFNKIPLTAAEKITDHDVIIQMLSEYIKEQGLPVRIVGEDENITDGVVLEYSAPYTEVPTLIEKFMAENNIDENEVTFRILDIAYGDVKGDVNADGVFSIADVVLFNRWILGDKDVHLANWKAADLCKDDKLDVFDLTLMRRALLEELNIDPSIDDSEIPEVLFGDYDENNNKPMSAKRIAMKCKSFCDYSEVLKVDVAMADSSLTPLYYDVAGHYKFEIYASTIHTNNKIEDENLIINGEHGEYIKEYSQEDLELFDINGKVGDYNSYHHETVEIDFSNYEIGSLGRLTFGFLAIYDEDPLHPSYVGTNQFMYFYVGEKGTAVSNHSVEDAKEKYQAILDIENAKDDYQSTWDSSSDEQEYC